MPMMMMTIMLLLMMMLMPHSITRTYLAWPDDVQKLLAIYFGKRGTERGRGERKREGGRLSRQMSLPNGGLSNGGKAASATKCANYRNAITKGDATLPPRKNNKAKLLSDESSSSGSNNGANNNVTTMWQLLPIFSNKESEKAKNNKEKKPKQKLPQKIKR